MVASSLDSLQPVILDNFACKNDLATCLKASANVPEIAGVPVEHRWAARRGRVLAWRAPDLCSAHSVLLRIGRQGKECWLSWRGG